MNQLEKYLKDRQEKVTTFAAKAGVSTKTVYNWLSGDKTPSDSHKAVIYGLTNGEVDLHHWIPLPMLEDDDV